MAISEIKIRNCIAEDIKSQLLHLVCHILEL